VIRASRDDWCRNERLTVDIVGCKRAGVFLFVIFLQILISHQIHEVVLDEHPNACYDYFWGSNE
jgi:hypothetical protein